MGGGERGGVALGKCGGIPPAEGKGTFHRAKRVHYPLKYPGCLVATSPNAMEVRERPSQTLRYLWRGGGDMPIVWGVDYARFTVLPRECI